VLAIWRSREASPSLLQISVSTELAMFALHLNEGPVWACALTAKPAASTATDNSAARVIECI
jgi:hypothetical protein